MFWVAELNESILTCWSYFRSDVVTKPQFETECGTLTKDKPVHSPTYCTQFANTHLRIGWDGHSFPAVSSLQEKG